jgi:tetratricopeptide (TPR) repeat protein
MNLRKFAAVAVLVGGAVLSVLLWWRSDDRTPSQRFLDALAALERGQTDDLDRTFRALDSQPGLVDHARVLDAALSVRMGKPDAAIAKLARVKAVGELRRPVLFYTAQALHQQNRLVEAESLLRTLTTELPDDAEAFRWLGVVEYDLGATDAARAALLRLAELVPDDYRPHRLLGLMYLDFEAYGEAVPEYERALELSPPADVRAEVLVELARCQIAIRNYDSAIASLEQAPSTSKSQALLAKCLFNKGQMEQSKQRLEAARLLDTGNRDVLLLEAEIASFEKRHDDALRALRRVVGLFPHDPECRYRLGIFLQQRGDAAGSEAELARWKKENDLVDRLSQLNLQAGSDPHNAELRLQLAEVCDQLEKPELAQMWRDAAAACKAGPPAESRSVFIDLQDNSGFDPDRSKTVQVPAEDHAP